MKVSVPKLSSARYVSCLCKCGWRCAEVLCSVKIGQWSPYVHVNPRCACVLLFGKHNGFVDLVINSVPEQSQSSVISPNLSALCARAL